MKNSQFLKPAAIFFISLLLLFSNCEKITDYADKYGDETGGGENKFTYKGKDYPLDFGFMEDYGEGERGSYNIDLTLSSEDEEYLLYFEMYSSTDGDLKSGDYNYDSTESEDPMTFDFGEFYVDFDNESDNEIDGGKVKIQKSGNTYTITITVTGEGSSLTGYYKGTLTYQ